MQNRSLKESIKKIKNFINGAKTKKSTQNNNSNSNGNSSTNNNGSSGSETGFNTVPAVYQVRDDSLIENPINKIE